MAQVSGKIIQELLLILTPFMRDKQDRQAYLTAALGTNSPVLNHLVWDTSANVFIPQMINKLVTFGEITSGEPALCALLEVVRRDVGLDKQLELDNLLQKIRQELQQPSLYFPSELQTDQENVEWQESTNFFLPELTFIDEDGILPGAVFPNGMQINFNGKIVTPLIPLHPILLKNFTPEDLINKVHFQSINNGNFPGVRVIIDMPIWGIKNNDKYTHNSCIYKDYILKEKNIYQVPVLEVWPYFRVEGWKEYYVLYYDCEYGEETFQVSLPDAQEPHIFQEGRGSYQIAHLEEFPSHIICQDSARNIVGLIFLKTPEKIQSTGIWRVGVDFGTSFSNVYINRNGIVEPLTQQNLHLQVTDVSIDTRFPVLFEFFIPEYLIPVDKPFPLANILTLRGNRKVSLENSRPILDARFYIPDRNRFNPKEDWIKDNVNFENLILAKLFLQHLALHITALAAKRAVSQIQWCLSYPPTISLDDKEKYLHIWQDLTKDLQEKTGIKHICPEIYDLIHFRSKSLAFAQYFADREDHQLVYSTCINIEDRISNISDICIWQNNNLIHQCSIQLAVRDLFSQFLELNPKFLERMLKHPQGHWQGLDQKQFNAKLDIFLRLEGKNWLKNKRALMEKESDFQELLRLTALGFAGLYYYVGTILKVLFDEKKYTINEITPVYMGGNGSQLLHWLAIEGRFDRHSEVNRLLSRMLSRGSSFLDTEESTYLSTRPQDEVACGLVSEVTKLQYLTVTTKDPIISGEDCKVNGQLISWRKRLELEVNIEEFHVPEEMLQLRNFFDQFNLALKELEIDGLIPLRDYQPSQGVDANQKLWRDTYKELTGVTLKIKGNAKNIRPEPPFILALKALMHVLGKEWAGK